VPIRINVNGEWRALRVEPRRTLVDLLRHDLGLVGTHAGCEQGVCGACTVLLDDEPVRSCLLFAVQADGAHVETVESLAAGMPVQCGFCTPGYLMLATALLRKERSPSRTRVREVMSSNLCPCSGYVGIIDAVESMGAS
jgi:carbon-monoxide dehydrogenase small subunit